MFFHLIFKHNYKVDVIDAEKTVRDDKHQAVTMVGSEPKLSKSKLPVSEEEHILLGRTIDNANQMH